MTTGTGESTAIFSTARKVLQLFDQRERRKLAGIFAAMVATGLLQTAGIASIMPFIALAADPDMATEGSWVSGIYDGLGFESTRSFLLALGLAVLALITISNAFMAFTLWITLRFIWSTHHRISEQLLEHYLRRPYSFYLGRNTARLSKTLLSEVKEVIRGVLVPGMEALTRAISTVFVIALLILVDPILATLVALALSGSYALIYLTVRRKQKELGHQRVAAQTSRYKVASEAFGGIKDVKILGRESHFVTRFRGPSQEYSRANAVNAVVSEMPRFVLETIAFGGIVAVVLYLLQTRDTLGDVLPLIGLYAMAGNRLMPSLQQIFAGLTKIRFHAAALEDLHADLGGYAARHAGGPSSDREAHGFDRSEVVDGSLAREIRFSNVSFQYPASEEFALRDVDLTIPAGSMVGLIGPTGSGKSTVLDLLLGLFTPTRGAILVDGTPLEELTGRGWGTRVGYVPQTIYLMDDTITRNIAYGIPDEEIDLASVERALRAAHLHDFVDTLPDRYETIVGERGVRLSGGQRQRLGIARALYHDPGMLVLDEATSALDTATEDAVMDAIWGLADRRTIVMIAHRLTTVRFCHVIYLLEGGTVTAQGTYEELAATSSTFRALARMP